MDAIKAIIGGAEMEPAVLGVAEPVYHAPAIKQTKNVEMMRPSSTGGAEPELGIKFDTEQLKELLDKINTVLASYNTKLSFGMENNISWVRIINLENNETIKQIPPEEIVKTLMRLKEVAGILINEEK